MRFLLPVLPCYNAFFSKLAVTSSMSERQAITSEQLLSMANQLIQSHDDYLEGMIASSVEEKAGVLIFKGEYFLNEQGLPTQNTTRAFNMFKYLAHVLSKQYRLS